MVINAAESENAKGQAKIAFEQEVFNFGKISQGEKIDFSFTFKNEGDAPLILASVKPACGCTVTKDWPKSPILPGETGEIGVSYNSEGRKGVQTKGINIVSNSSPSTTVLYLEGEVMAPNN